MSTSTIKQDSSLASTLEFARAVAQDVGYSEAKRWLGGGSGRKAFGYFPIYSPVELIHATGMLPVGIVGGGDQIEIAHADSRFQSFVCSIVKSTLELGLTERLKFLSGMVFHSICDPARNLTSVFERNFPGMHIEYIHFPQNFTSPTNITYLESEYRRVLDGLEKLADRKVTAEDLNRSIDLYNRIRATLRALYQVRAESPQLLSASENWLLTRLGTLIAPEDYLPMLEQALAEVKTRTARPKDRVRVVLEGSFCEQPPIGLVECLEEAGCYILDDDFLLGSHWFTGDIPIESNALHALAESYSDRSVFSGVKHDLRESKAAHLVRNYREKKADAVIFMAPKFCEPALFDYALYRRAFEEQDIPHLFLEYEEKTWIFDRPRTEVETFVESILFD
ncbi:MAG: 2-hydroxyacyl-CoA dehydratase [Acidobacteria bacterium]|nr:2-hydroxyacyl-CoA dehydratase [Acidobacteriota bacterium]